MFFETRLRVSSLMTRIASRIFVFNSLNVCEGFRYTINFMCPQRQQSQGVKSGEPAGHEIGPPPPIHRPRSFCRNILILYWHSPIKCLSVGRSCFLDSLQSWEAKNAEVFFHTYFPSDFRLQKSKPRLSAFSQMRIIYNWREVLPRLIHLVRVFYSPYSAILLVC